MNPEYDRRLEKMKACPQAREWISSFDTPKEAWDQCTNIGWMAWLLEHLKLLERYTPAITRDALIHLHHNFTKEQQYVVAWAVSALSRHTSFEEDDALVSAWDEHHFTRRTTYFAMSVRSALLRQYNSVLFDLEVDFPDGEKLACDLVRKNIPLSAVLKALNG